MDMDKAIPSKAFDYDRVNEMKVFNETKAGVKGLVDSGVIKIPKFFIHSEENLPKESDSTGNHLQIPIIDLDGVVGTRRKLITDEIRKASETWGFFQLVNHGVPVNVFDEMIEGVKQFHEQPTQEKMKLYARDYTEKVTYYSNGDFYEYQAANWRDSLSCNFIEDELDSDQLPQVCREILVEYVKCIIKLKDTLSELLSEALGLNSDYLNHIGCMTTESWIGHYYPICPEPDLTLGNTKHSDPSFLTILLQDQIGGLQVLHQHQWVDVVPMKGSLLVNIGDLLQLITNDKFKSVDHRVLARSVGPRISVATFFFPNPFKPTLFGPIKELVSENNPPIYREILVNEYIAFHKAKGPDGTSSLPHFKL